MKVLSKLMLAGTATAALVIPSAAAFASTPGYQCRETGTPVYSFQHGFTYLPQPVSTCPAELTAITFVSDRPDGGNGSPPYWADDTFTRTITITRVSPGTYTAVLRDTGTFRTIRGADTPNQSVPGEKIRRSISGSMTGYADFSFTASSSPDSVFNLGVPLTENDHGNVPADSTSSWYELAFPSGTTFGGGIGNWSWSYTAGSQHWTDASGNGSGDLPRDGNITG